MKPATGNYERHEQAIAMLLWYGTWLASAILTVGMSLEAFGQIEGLLDFGLNGYSIVKAGVALFILLPIARVALMLFIFLRERDYAYVGISALVLAIIMAGIVIGLA